MPCKWVGVVCQNCVTCPSIHGSNTVVFRRISKDIVVGANAWEVVLRCVFVWCSMRRRNLFPSALLQPLGHLSVSLESSTYGNTIEPNRKLSPRIVPNTVGISEHSLAATGNHLVDATR